MEIIRFCGEFCSGFVGKSNLERKTLNVTLKIPGLEVLYISESRGFWIGL